MATSSPQTAPQSRNCVRCGRSIAWDMNVCPYCGHDYRYQSYAQPPAAGYQQANVGVSAPPVGQYQAPYNVQTQKTAMPVAGGVLVLLGGIIGIIMGLITVVLAGLLSDWMGMYDGYVSEVTGIMLVLGIVGIVLCLVAIIGGAFAMMRKMWAMSLIGAICLIIGGIFTGYIPIIFGIIGVILIGISKAEFQS